MKLHLKLITAAVLSTWFLLLFSPLMDLRLHPRTNHAHGAFQWVMAKCLTMIRVHTQPRLQSTESRWL